MTNHWAVLIGICHYKDKPLKGCVRDVQFIKQYLEAGSTSVDITTLTASAPTPESSLYPPEPPESLPTYDNVTSKLERVMKDASKGDSVYLHYSGHGTRRKEDKWYSNKDGGDLALVLYDGTLGTRHLFGSELAYFLDGMVKKGLSVTFALDCCFSGSVARNGEEHDATVRAIDYDPAIDAAYRPKSSTTPYDQGSALRDARILHKWLVDPEGYTILSACSPYERAYELKLDGGEERNGALSYFLLCALHALRKKGTEITHQSLYDSLSFQFHLHWPKQSPMRYGNKNCSFFGERIHGPVSIFTPASKRDGSLLLGAGRVHGVHEGDEYALYRFESREDVQQPQPLAKVKVDTVRPFESKLVEIEAVPLAGAWQDVWKARPLTRLAPWKLTVRLGPAVGDEAQWIAAANTRHFLQLSPESGKEDQQPYLFTLTRNGDNEFEVLDHLDRKIGSLPTIPVDGTRAMDRVLDVLEHLAAFKYVERIENRIPNVGFEHSFEIQLEPQVGDSRFLDVNDEDKVRLTVKNFASKPLYLAIFDLGPSWQIDSLLGQRGGADFRAIPQKGEPDCDGEITWQMNVPEPFRSRGQHQCDDILKVFVTSKSTSFTSLVLPRITVPVQDFQPPVRGNYSPLLQFLAALDAHFRGSGDGTSDGEWSTQNFYIHTTAK